ncbi:MAG: class I SAM-dependent methyltransferase [Allomuricauda sp.]
MDIFGQALQDYYSGNYTEDIKTYSSLDEEDTLPLPYLFRDFGTMPILEKKALELCKGKVLDIGCGAGNHSLYLQNKGLDVTALDQSEGAVVVCKNRGINSIVHSTILDYEGEKFDTILLLMNGIGLAERLNNIDVFLAHLRSLLHPNGQILLDSSDIIYMFEQDEDGGYWIPDNVPYYGEVTFQMEYKEQKGLPFPWLYIDFNTLKNACIANNMNCEIVINGEHFDYLAKLSFKE